MKARRSNHATTSAAGTRMPWHSALAAVLCLVSSWPGWSMDLLSVYQAALEQDASLRAARAVNAGGHERLAQAQAQLRPSIGFTASRNYNDLTRSQSNPGGQMQQLDERYYSQNQSLQLRLPLYRRPLSVGLAQARFIVADADAVLEKEQHQLGERVVAGYLDVLLAQDQWRLVRQQQATIRMQLDAARKAFVAGEGTRTDIDDVQARLDLNLAQELQARQQVDVAEHRLSGLINQPLGPLARLDPMRLPLAPPVPSELQNWVKLAEAHNPEMHSLRAQLQAAELEVAKASAGHHPTLDLVLQATRSASENTTTPSSSYTNRLVGLQFTLPLYAGGYVASQVRQALAARTEAEALLEANRRDLAVRVHQELRGVSEGVLKVRAMEQAVRSADQLVLSSQRSFEAGTRTLVDILNAEEALQTAHRDLARERYQYLLARFKLQALTGGDKATSIAALNDCLQTEVTP